MENKTLSTKTDTMQTNLSRKDFLKLLLKLALPICFQQFMLASVGAADAFMLGSVEQNSMAAVSLATQIQFIQNMIMASVISATTVLGAQYWGKQDMKSLDDIFSLSLRLCAFVSVLFFSLCTLIPGKLMFIYTNEPALIAIGESYLRIAGFSYLLTGISQSFLAMMKVTDHVFTGALISSSAVVVNIVLNAVFIYSLKLGAIGAAIATLTARCLEVILAVSTSFRRGFIHPKLRELLHINKNLTSDFFKCMLPLLGAGLLWGLGFTSYPSFMGHLGTDAAASNSVTAVIRDLICCACDGLASGCGIMVGNELGSGNLARGKSHGRRMLKLSFIVGILSALLMFAISPAILAGVKLTEQARTYLMQMLAVMSVYMIGRSVNSITINGIFAAGGDTLFDMYSLAVVMWAIAVPLAALGTYVFHWPVVLVYACTCLDEVGKIPWTMLHFKKYKWVKDLTRDRQ